ncbi:MAG: hypothetical protein WBZ19_16995 [Chthoniobacterales bacterium]
MRVESNSDGTQTWVYLLCEGKIFIQYDSPFVKKAAIGLMNSGKGRFTSLERTVH